MLLTRPPLTSEEQAPRLFARLACIRHAASVHPEPGSNSHINMSCSNSSICCSSELTSQMLLFASVPKYQGPCTFKRNFVQFSKDDLVKRQLWYIITSNQCLSITFFHTWSVIVVAHLRRFLSYQRFAPSSTTFSIKNYSPNVCK